MSYAERHTVSVTTIADGSATAYSEVITGRIHSMTYTKTDFTDGVDFTITLEATGQTVWTQSNVNATATVAPRIATTDTAGVASLYAAAGEPVEDYLVAAEDRVKIVIAAGGDTKTGTFTIIVA